MESKLSLYTAVDPPCCYIFTKEQKYISSELMFWMYTRAKHVRRALACMKVTYA